MSCDSSSSSGIFKKLDAQDSGSIELDFNQVRTNNMNFIMLNRTRFRLWPSEADPVSMNNLQMLTLSWFLRLFLQWLNFAMIWAGAPRWPGAPVLLQDAIFVFTAAASLLSLRMFSVYPPHDWHHVPWKVIKCIQNSLRAGRYSVILHV